MGSAPARSASALSKVPSAVHHADFNGASRDHHIASAKITHDDFGRDASILCNYSDKNFCQVIDASAIACDQLFIDWCSALVGVTATR